MSKKGIVLPLLVVYAALMAVLTYYDLPIAKAIYMPGNLFGKIFEVVGIIPAMLAGIFGGIAVFLTRPSGKRGIGSWVLAALGTIGFPAFSIIAIVNLNRPFVWLFVVLIVGWEVGAFFLARWLVKKGRGLPLRRFAIMLIVAASAGIFGQTAAKYVFNRPRFITLTDESQYTPWYVVHNFAHDSSFPSGHTSQSAVVLTLAYMPVLLGGKRPKWLVPIVLLAGLAFVGSVGVSRMTLGVHYATDVVTGFMLSAVGILICDHAIHRKGGFGGLEPLD